MSKLGIKAGRPSARDGSTKAKMLADLADKPVKPVRVNFDLDRDRHQRLKLLAVKEGRTVADILRDLVDRELAKNTGV